MDEVVPLDKLRSVERIEMCNCDPLSEAKRVSGQCKIIQLFGCVV